MVKDVADIPQEFRAIVDAHRKLGSSIKERATLATKVMALCSVKGRRCPLGNGASPRPRRHAFCGCLRALGVVQAAPMPLLLTRDAALGADRERD